MFRAHPRWAVAVVVVLFTGVLVTRLLAGDAAGLLYVPPIALAAVAFGRRAGLVAGLLGVALVVLWAVVREADISWLGWVSRVVPLLLLGVLLGGAAERLEETIVQGQRLVTDLLRGADLAPGRHPTRPPD